LPEDDFGHFSSSQQQADRATDSRDNFLSTGAVPANQPVSGGEATDRRKSFRRKMADCPS